MLSLRRPKSLFHGNSLFPIFISLFKRPTTLFPKWWAIKIGWKMSRQMHAEFNISMSNYLYHTRILCTLARSTGTLFLNSNYASGSVWFGSTSLWKMRNAARYHGAKLRRIFSRAVESSRTLSEGLRTKIETGRWELRKFLATKRKKQQRKTRASAMWRERRRARKIPIKRGRKCRYK